MVGPGRRGAFRRMLVAAAVVVGLLAACVGEDPAPSLTGGPDANADASVSQGALDGKASSAEAGAESGGNACWPYAPDSYDPCGVAFDMKHPTAASKTVDADVTLDTDEAEDAIADGGATYAFYRFASFTVGAKGILTVKGSLPALIVVDGDVTVDGRIIVLPSTATPLAVCAKVDSGSNATNCTGGGGGGGYGGAGGNGGGNAPVGGAVNGNTKLAPLRPGCPGGRSGEPKPQTNGGVAGASSASGGAGGGALGISARGAVTISNTASIVANGGGGGGGDAHAYSSAGPCHTTDTRGCNSGGGGGGSGGSILIEGASVTVMGSVCAVGGGGGAGGTEAGTVGTGGATSTSCAAATGGGAPTSETAGGAGGAVADAVNGHNASCGYTSSGGGGGGVGRIRIRASTLRITGTVVPPAFTN